MARGVNGPVNLDATAKLEAAASGVETKPVTKMEFGHAPGKIAVDLGDGPRVMGSADAVQMMIGISSALREAIKPPTSGRQG